VATVRTGAAFAFLAAFARPALPSAPIANASFGPDQIKVLTQGFDGPDKFSRFDLAVAIVLAASFAAWVLAYAVLLIMYGEHAGY
jgi:hypothetical protein